MLGATSNPSVSVYFEVSFPKLTPGALRTEISKAFSDRVDGLASNQLGWMDQPYAGPMSPAAALAHVGGLMSKTNPLLTASSAGTQDTYCRVGPDLFCYFFFDVELNGKLVFCPASADGRSIECPLQIALKYVPAS